MDRRKFTTLLASISLAAIPLMATNRTTDRTIQVKHNNNWLTCKMKDLDIGDTFRMFDPDGTIVAHKNKSEWIVEGKPYQKLYSGKYVWAVNCND